MSVRCKSKFTSYVKHYTRREKQGWFLVLKDICVSIKSASCVLNTAGWSYSDQMAFCLSLQICQAQLFSRAASVSGSSGEVQDKPLLHCQSYGNQISLLPELWSSLGRARLPEAPGWQELSPKWSCASAAESQAAWWSLVTRRKWKRRKRPSCANQSQGDSRAAAFVGKSSSDPGKGGLSRRQGAGKPLQEVSVRAQHCWAPSRKGKSQPEEMQGQDDQKHQGICDLLTKWDSKPVLPLAC